MKNNNYTRPTRRENAMQELLGIELERLRARSGEPENNQKSHRIFRAWIQRPWMRQTIEILFNEIDELGEKLAAWQKANPNAKILSQLSELPENPNPHTGMNKMTVTYEEDV